MCHYFAAGVLNTMTKTILLMIAFSLGLSAQAIPPAPVDPSAAVAAYVAWAQATIKALQDQVAANAANAAVNAWLHDPANGQLLRLYTLNKGAPPFATFAMADSPTQACISWSRSMVVASPDNMVTPFTKVSP
jgi:hypothetical protein